MTRKHYEAIAEEIKTTLATCDTQHARTVTKLHAKRLAEYFATDNAKFQAERFLTACGIE